MQLASHLPHPLTEEQRAAELLDPRHPFVGTLRALSAATRQALVVAALLVLTAAPVAEGLMAALPLVVGAAVVLCALAARVALLVLDRRRRAVDLIAEGHAALPVEAVERARERLLDRDNRAILARTLEAMCAQAGRPCPPRARPIYNARTFAEVAPDLAIIAALLRQPTAGVRGVAMIERLVCDGTLPLYGTDVRALQEELRRIRFHLVEENAPVAPTAAVTRSS